MLNYSSISPLTHKISDQKKFVNSAIPLEAFVSSLGQLKKNQNHLKYLRSHFNWTELYGDLINLKQCWTFSILINHCLPISKVEKDVSDFIIYCNLIQLWESKVEEKSRTINNLFFANNMI